MSQRLQIRFFTPNPNLLNYYVFKKVFSESECDEIVETNFTLTEAVVGGNKVHDIRKSFICWIPQVEKWKKLYEKVMELVSQCNREFYKFDINGMFDDIQYTEYDSSYKGNYGWHYDLGEDMSVQTGRKISVSIQLSDPEEYDGGELQFSMHENVIYTAPKDRGTMILFPSYMKHRVTPVTRGKRISLVTWISGPPFR